MKWQPMAIDDTGSVECMPLYIAQSGYLDRFNGCLTDGQTLKDSATQLQEWSSHNAMSH